MIWMASVVPPPFFFKPSGYVCIELEEHKIWGPLEQYTQTLRGKQVSGELPKEIIQVKLFLDIFLIKPEHNEKNSVKHNSEWHLR